MWQLIAASSGAFAASWTAAVVVTALGHWVPAVPLLAVAGAAWAAAGAASMLWSRGQAWWTPPCTVGAVSVAMLASLAWFGTLYAAIAAYNPAALTAPVLDGWAPYGLAIDVMRSGMGIVLPYSLGARIAVGVEQLVVWPTVLVLIATLVASLGPRRR